jgi:hypothetical protein
MSNIEKLNVQDAPSASVTVGKNANEDMVITGRFTATCYDSEGNLKWEEHFPNLVVNVGKIDLLNKYFAGSAYTAAWYLGLVNGGTSPTYNAADTMSSHSGWTEVTGYSNATRPAASFGSATASGGGAGAGTFVPPCTIEVIDLGAGTLTITPTTSTIGGNSTLVLNTGQGATIVSDGANYQVAAGVAGLVNSILPGL